MFDCLKKKKKPIMEIPLPTGNVFRTAGYSKKPKDATKYLKGILDSDFEYEVPYGFYYIKETLISNADRYFNWNGSVVYTDKNINMLKVRGSAYTHANLTLDSSQCKKPTPDKVLLTLQNHHTNTSFWQFINLRLKGNASVIWNEVGKGHLGFDFDVDEDWGSEEVRYIGENHWGTIDIQQATGLYQVGRISKEANQEKLMFSRADIYIQGGVCKKVIEIIGCNGVNVYLKWNDSPILFEEEQDLDLVLFDGLRLSLRKEIVDFGKDPKFNNVQKVYKYYHKYKLTNKQKQCCIMPGVFDQNATKLRNFINEITPIKYLDS